MSKIFVTGIGTDVGKTIVSAILCQALSADYWKPVQSGIDLDSATVRSLISNSASRIHPEGMHFKAPLSPHAAAALENRSCSIGDLTAPSTSNILIIEGAGGLLVPLNERELMIDLLAALKAQPILVSRHYLGSINHTLLSLEALHSRGIPAAGIIFVGNENITTESAIRAFSKVPILGRIDEAPEITSAFIKDQAQKIAPLLRSAIL